jgi:hypothetical protein
MAEFRHLCRTYSDAYQNKLTTRKVSPEVQGKLDSCEKIIDVFNIVLIRQKIEMEVIHCFSFCFKEIYLPSESNIRIFIQISDSQLHSYEVIFLV